nr:hypothetical protein [Candidatus Sigynarchaeota archaeon]
MAYPFTRLEGMKTEAGLDPAIRETIATIKSQVLQRVRPAKEEITRLAMVTKRVSEALGAALDGGPVTVDFIEPQGSTGIKQTQLAGDSDVDLFIGLNPGLLEQYKGMLKKQVRESIKNIFTKSINDVLIPAIKEKLHPQSIMFSYAEHPYLTVVVDGVKFDIVFCFHLTSEYIEREDIVTAMDRTPLHSKFVRDNLTDAQKDEVRLLKVFFKASYVYGDKSAPGPMGFIGYGLEILIHFFGTIENVMANFSRLPDQPIDIFGRTKKELRSMPRFDNDFLIIIDPTDRNRNVGSSTEARCFYHAQQVIADFLKAPKTQFFDIKPIPDPQNDDPHFFAVVFDNAREVHYTIVRDKLYHLGNLAEKKLEREQTGEERFGTMTSAILLAKDEKQAAIAFHVKNPSIPATFHQLGPARTEPKARIKTYLQKHPDAKVDDKGFYFIERQRNITNFKDALTKFLKAEIDIKGLSPLKDAAGFYDPSSNPGLPIGRQAIHVLKAMVLPHMKQS